MRYGTAKAAQDQFEKDLKAGQVYISFNTKAGSENVFMNEIRGPLVAAATALLEGLALSPSNLRSLTLGPETLNCNKDPHPELGKCLIPVYVWTDQGNVCWAFVPFGKVMIAPTTRPRLVWLLVNSNVGDAREYRFTPGQGVQLQPVPGSTDMNDPSKDFNGPGDDNGESRRFKWNSVHQRKSSYPYSISTQVLKPNGNTYPCQPADPTVTNE